MTRIQPCTCAHAAQDKKWGRGQRVHNQVGKKRQQSGTFWRCSVCKSEKGK